MFCSVTYQAGTGWVVDERVVNTIPDLSDLYHDKSYGAQCIAFIALMCDPSSKFAGIADEDRREKLILHAVYRGNPPKDLTKNKMVRSAMEMYEELAMTPAVKIKQQYKNAVVESGNQLQDGKIQDEEKAKLLKELPSMIKAFEEMDKSLDADTAEAAAVITGGVQLTARESRLRNKKKKK